MVLSKEYIERVREAIGVLQKAKSSIPLGPVGDESTKWMRSIQGTLNFLGGTQMIPEPIAAILPLEEHGSFRAGVVWLTKNAGWTFTPSDASRIVQQINLVSACLESALLRESEQEIGATSTGEGQETASAESPQKSTPQIRMPKSTRRAKSLKPEPVFAEMEKLKWEEISIDFLDGSQVNVEARGKRHRYDFSEMGFKDDRTGEPNIAWKMLHILAQTNAVLQRPRGEERSAFRKRKESLANYLKGFFGISDDPLPWVESDKSWKALFKIRPQAGKGEFSPPRRIPVPKKD